jgi:hypothetical protein
MAYRYSGQILKCKCMPSIYADINFTLNSNKVVADGTVSFVLDHPVRARISRYAWGVKCSILYNPNIPEHVKRTARCYEDCEGDTMIPDTFSIILPKVVCYVTFSHRVLILGHFRAHRSQRRRSFVPRTRV